jgi:hypothetical protein
MGARPFNKIGDEKKGAKILPSLPPKKIQVEGEDGEKQERVLSGDERRNWATWTGQEYRQLYKIARESDDFKQLSVEEQARLIGEHIRQIQTRAKSTVLGIEPKNPNLNGKEAPRDPTLFNHNNRVELAKSEAIDKLEPTSAMLLPCGAYQRTSVRK